MLAMLTIFPEAALPVGRLIRHLSGSRLGAEEGPLAFTFG
jgi:hypothetical protein